MKRPKLLQSREKTHGDFVKNANISQDLKEIIRSCPDWEGLCAVHKESLDMICLKISRIMSGHAKFKDHWDDIAGYAKLATEDSGPE